MGTEDEQREGVFQDATGFLARQQQRLEQERLELVAGDTHRLGRARMEGVTEGATDCAQYLPQARVHAQQLRVTAI